jgi:serine/threonine-protein kinase
MTEAGIILGTAAYMAPEQARGKAIDKRADIWAFGCVLFEMLTARRVFEGDDISSTLAAVLKSDPEWSALPSAAPASLRRLLIRCFQKDPKKRLRDIGEARFAIDEMLNGVAIEAAPLVPVRGASWWPRLGIPLATLLVGSVVTGVAVWLAARSPGTRPRVSRYVITAPLIEALSSDDATHRDVAITPDGSRIIYVGANGTTLFVRPLDRLEATPLAHGGSLRDPFVSPDGQWVGFIDGLLTLKKVAVTGGPAVLVARLDMAARGATWAADGTIIFATNSTTTGLRRVSASGDEPTLLTRPDRARGEAGHVWPELLPGGQAVLYTVLSATGGLDAASIAVLELRTGRSTILLRGGSHAQYATSGHLVYGAAGGLRAVAFDITHLTVPGTTTLVLPEVLTTSTGAVDAMLARDGTLVYVAGDAARVAARTLVWVDRQGHEAPIGTPPRDYYQPRVSPDGTRIAVMVLGQNADIWVWDAAQTTLTPITTDPARDDGPLWMEDSRRVIFGSDRAGAYNLFSQAADGTGAADLLTKSPNPQFPTGVSPDGTRVVFTETFPKTGEDVMVLQLDGTRHALPLVQTPFDERNGIVSSHRGWLAYEANDSGVFQIYVRPFPEVNSARWQVSTNGGTQPLWAPGGEELFYVAPDGALMRVAVAKGPTWKAGTPTKMLEGRYVVSTAVAYRNYDVSADGQRFLMVKASGGAAPDALPQIVVVEHFDEELKRRVPAK